MCLGGGVTSNVNPDANDFSNKAAAASAAMQHGATTARESLIREITDVEVIRSMLALLAISVLIGILLAGLRYNGAWLAGIFLTYQAGALAQLPWLGTAYVVAAIVLSASRYFKSVRPMNWHASDFAAIFLTLMLTASMYWTQDLGRSTEMVQQFLTSIIGTFILARFVTGRPRPLTKQMVVTLAIGSAVLAVGLVNMRATGTWAADHRLVLEDSDASTVGLTQPIPFALVASALMALTYKGIYSRVLGVVCLILVSYLAVVAGTRSVFLSGIIALLVALVLSLEGSLVRRNLLFLPIGVIAAVFFYDSIPTQEIQGQLDRLTGSFTSGPTPVDASSLERIHLFDVALSLIQDNPIFGVGYGAYGRYTFQDYPHNVFLEITSSVGAVGLTIFLLWMFAHVRDLVVVLSKNREIGVTLIAFSLAAFLQLQVSFAFSTAKPLFVIVAFAAAMRDRSMAKYLNKKRIEVFRPKLIQSRTVGV